MDTFFGSLQGALALRPAVAAPGVQQALQQARGMAVLWWRLRKTEVLLFVRDEELWSSAAVGCWHGPSIGGRHKDAGAEAGVRPRPLPTCQREQAQCKRVCIVLNFNDEWMNASNGHVAQIDPSNVATTQTILKVKITIGSC